MTLASSPRPAASLLSGCLKVVAVCVVLLLIAGIALIWSISQSFKAIDPQPVPELWATQDIALSPGAPAVHGTLRVSSTSSDTSNVVLGVNAGAPTRFMPQAASGSAAATPSAVSIAVALDAPVVRLTATNAAGSWQCDAPCELALPSLACTTQGCASSFELAVALVSAGSGSGTVRVAVSGGGLVQGSAYAKPSPRLPDGFTVDLALGTPGASGGG